jgi:hypothetical protein
MTDEDKKLHWLVRPATIRKLWIASVILLGMTVLAQFAVPLKGKFGIDGWLAFPAVYGFVTCVLMVVFAKLLGFMLKRRDDYYND